MLGVYASALLIVTASVVVGQATLDLVGLRRFTWLSAVTGFSVLVVVTPILIRLPGQARSAAILVALAVIASAWRLWARRRDSVPRSPRDGAGSATVAAIASVVVLAAASLPFAFNERNGVLGEGIYTNDQAAQLYWTDWLQHHDGPEPSAVRFGYPTGPQAVAATAAEAVATNLISSFNGLLLAIPVLTALTALAALEGWPAGRRIVAASLAGLPYLGASFLAQSAFKETAMALFVLAFAVALQVFASSLRGESRGAGPHPWRALASALLLLGAASVFVYSVPGLVWLAIALPIWLLLEGEPASSVAKGLTSGGTLRRHANILLTAVILLVAVVVFFAAELSGFIQKLATVQGSTGRLSSPVYPGEALGIWPHGDFQVGVAGAAAAYAAVALGLVAVAIGAVAAVRRRDWGFVAVGASAVIVYVGARLLASYYVEAKALAVMAPLVVLIALTGLLAPHRHDGGTRGVRISYLRLGFGTLMTIAFAGSTLLALRAAPVGFDQRGVELERLAARIKHRSVLFLGVDRFSAYWLRGARAKSPGGNVPGNVPDRRRKPWRPGLPLDFDSTPSRELDRFDYAITTRAGYQSTAPPNFHVVAHTPSFLLWKRTGATRTAGILDERGAPGRVLNCRRRRYHLVARRGGVATALHPPVVGSPNDWSLNRPFDAPAVAQQRLSLRPGRWRLSLQYASQVPLRVSAGGQHVNLPPSLDGMYIDHKGLGAFWSVGAVHSRGGRLRIRVAARTPTPLQRFLGMSRRVWLGRVAATLPGRNLVAMRSACGRYIDHWRTPL